MHRIGYSGLWGALVLAAVIAVVPAFAAKRALPAVERYRIALPADGAQVGPEPVSLVIEGIDGATFRALRLLVDGGRNEPRTLQLPQPQSRWTLTQDVAQLRPGEHRFTVDVYQAPGVFQRLRLRLVTRGAAPGPAPAAATPPPANTPPAGPAALQEKLASARRLAAEQPEEAERLAREALRACGENGDPDQRAEALACLREVGRTLYYTGHRAFTASNTAEARRSLERALVIAHDCHDPTTYFGCNADMVPILVQTGDLPQARVRLGHLEEVLAEMPLAPSSSQVSLLTRYAAALTQVGRPGDAITCLDRTGAMFAEIEQARLAALTEGIPPATRVGNEVPYARYWSAWLRAYLDALKAQPEPPRAAVETASRTCAGLLERLTALSKEAEAAVAAAQPPARRTLPVSTRLGVLRLLGDEIAALQAIQAEIDALAARTRGASSPPGGSAPPRPAPGG